MTDLPPVNARLDGPNALTVSSSPGLAAQTSAPQAGNTIELFQPLDPMALDLKALRQQALSTQAGIQQLQLEQPGGSFANVLSELPMGLTPGIVFLGIGVLILGGMLSWSGTRRWRTISIAMEREFVDSYVPPDDQQDQSILDARELARLNAATLPETLPALPTESQFSSDSAQSAPGSGLDVNLDNLLSIKDPVIQAVRSSPANPVATLDQALEFDPEAAADEVERVLRSLAIKRAADQDGKDQDPALGQDAPALSLEDDKVLQAETHQAALLMDFDMRDQSVDKLQVPVPVVAPAAPGQDTAHGPDHAVQLSLAQELDALGLILGARELATEVLNSTDTSLSSRAQALLRQIEDQESAHQSIV